MHFRQTDSRYLLIYSNYQELIHFSQALEILCSRLDQELRNTQTEITNQTEIK